MYKGKMFKVGESDRKNIEMTNEKNPMKREPVLYGSLMPKYLGHGGAEN